MLIEPIQKLGTIAVNALSDCLTVGKAALRSFGGEELETKPHRVFQP